MSKILVTGATGLVGSYVAKKYLDNGNEVICQTRNTQKARDVFRDRFYDARWIEQDITDRFDCDVDIIIHTAAPTSGSFMVNKPVDTVKKIVNGTINVLELARKCSATLVNMSSMEVYGDNLSDKPLREDDLSTLNISNMRNSYPEAKRLCEMLCAAYSQQFEVNAISLRLASVIPDKLSNYDNRAVQYFCKLAIEGEDIKLNTDGSTRQSFVGINDVWIAIQTVVDKGVMGEPYNVANHNMYMSIYDLAKKIADITGVDVIRKCKDDNQYPDCHNWNLATDKLEKLGWMYTGDADKLIKVLLNVVS